MYPSEPPSRLYRGYKERIHSLGDLDAILKLQFFEKKTEIIWKNKHTKKFHSLSFDDTQL